MRFKAKTLRCFDTEILYFCTKSERMDTSSHQSSAPFRIGENVRDWIAASREGVSLGSVQSMLNRDPFTLREWAQLLDIPESGLRRHLQTGKPLGRVRSAQLLEILLILRRGLEVFEDEERFLHWLSSKSTALGDVAAKEMLDNSFGIQLVRDELGRIEYGILA